MRIAARTDANQKRLVEVWRRMGASVLILSAVGKGCPDVLVGCNGYNVLVEIKDGAKSLSAQKLTVMEQAFHETWKGTVCIVRDEVDAKELVYRMRSPN